METIVGPFTGLALGELAARLRDGQADPVDLTRRSLAAIADVQPTLNAFVTVDAEGALRAAAQARDELSAGLDRGPLHGLPVAVKDLIDTAGLVTTMGSRHFAGHRPDRDAEVVRRLRAAGAVVVGKTTTHEFAYGPTGDRSANGPGANPHDPTRMAGGSSAGSAAAVAAGLVPLALGTDTGGSVRIPAALCGVVGLRPSYGRLPTAGVFPLAPSLDCVGPLAGDVASTAVGWSVLAGLPSPLAFDGGDGVAGLRLGLVTGGWCERLDDTVHSALDALVRRLAEAGARVVPVAVADAEELQALYRTVQSVEAVRIHRERMTRAPELFDQEVLQRLQAAAEIPAGDADTAGRRLVGLRATAEDRLAGVDALLLATVPVTAPPLGARDGDIGGGWTSPREALLAHNTPWSVLGLPAISVPVPAPGRLPVGAQLIGHPGGDERLLAVAYAVEQLVGQGAQPPAGARGTPLP